MAEDVKAVAWLVANGRTFVDRAFVGIEAAEHARDTRNDGAEVQPLYPQQAIDALRAEVERLRAWAGGDASVHIGIERDLAVARAQRAEAEVQALRDLGGCAYQMAGIHDAPVAWLDALSNAASGRPFSTEGLLPYMPDLPEELEALRMEVSQLKDVRATLSVQSMDYEQRAQRAEAQAAELAQALAEMLELRTASIECRIMDRHELDIVRDARAALSRAGKGESA